MILRARFSKQPSKYSMMFGMASVCMCESLWICRFSWIQMGLYPVLVNLEIIILGCWTKFTLQEQCVYQNSLFPGSCRRRRLLGQTSNSGFSQPRPWFLLPYDAVLFVDLHLCRESLLLYLHVFRINELSLLWSFIATLKKGKLGKRRDLPEVM